MGENKCPKCGAPEVDAGTPRTLYACGSSDYDQRDGSLEAKCSRYCMYCLRLGGIGKRELRPYGPGGRDVCAGCVFDGPPERLKEAEAQLGARLLTSEPLLLDVTEQVGPRPYRSKGNA
jgi:hypothetical protein